MAGSITSHKVADCVMKGTKTRPGRPAVVRIKLIDNWPPPVRVNANPGDV